MKWIVLIAVAVGVCFAGYVNAKERIITRTVKVGYVSANVGDLNQVPAPDQPTLLNSSQMNDATRQVQQMQRSTTITKSEARCQCGCNRLGCRCSSSIASSSSNPGSYSTTVTRSRQLLGNAANRYSGPPAYTIGMTTKYHLTTHHGWKSEQLEGLTPQQLEKLHAVEHSQ